MNRDALLDSIGRIDEDMVQGVEVLRKRKKRSPWLKWGALAACLCLIAAVAVPIFLYKPEPTPPDSWFPNDGSESQTPESNTSNGDNCPEMRPPDLIVNGTTYTVTSHLSGRKNDQLPEGFSYAGEYSEDRPYYTNPDIPEHLYVYEVYTYANKVDSAGAVVESIPVYTYKRYVDQRLRGRELVYYNGGLYVSVHSAQDLDADSAFYEKVQVLYGSRIKGAAPEGFVSAGVTAFSGFDTVPRSQLACNKGAFAIYVNPDMPDMILLATAWGTHTADIYGNKIQEGFDVYIRYYGPLA